MTLLSISRPPEMQERVNKIIWQAIKRHHMGSVNPKNPSLLAQRLFDICTNIYDELDAATEDEHLDFVRKQLEKIETLEARIRELEGLPPLPPCAIA